MPSSVLVGKRTLCWLNVLYSERPNVGTYARRMSLPRSKRRGATHYREGIKIENNNNNNNNYNNNNIEYERSKEAVLYGIRIGGVKEREGKKRRKEKVRRRGKY